MRNKIRNINIMWSIPVILLSNILLAVGLDKEHIGKLHYGTKKYSLYPAIKRNVPILINMSVYNPTVEQCDNNPYITAYGDTINPNEPQRWVASSRDLGLKHNDTIVITSKVCPYLNGEWIVKDRSGGTRYIDILISNPNKVIINGSWKAYLTK